MISQLGFIPFDLEFDALEFSKHVNKEEFFEKNSYLKGNKFIMSSDAHYIDDVGCVFTNIECEELSFFGIKEWLKSK